MKCGNWFVAALLLLSCFVALPSLQAQNMTEEEAEAARIEQRFLNELETLLKAARDAQFRRGSALYRGTARREDDQRL